MQGTSTRRRHLETYWTCQIFVGLDIAEQLQKNTVTIAEQKTSIAQMKAKMVEMEAALATAQAEKQNLISAAAKVGKDASLVVSNAGNLLLLTASPETTEQEPSKKRLREDSEKAEAQCGSESAEI
ncbi:hypothetical protein TeGR_g9590 [Tetraparma gracilis]|uniref:Uncharacterized protein n=1 Tax=Tetraparma gracilis TaxID=2962635 RepID=A0ABQ6N527_9STRA|nr:hypothetical protein TeGR_g9590 [Tetraparma gracilis]